LFINGRWEKAKKLLLNLIIREINKQEIEEVRNLNRSEIVKQIYYYKNGALVLKDECHIIKDWIPEELRRNIEDFYDLHDRGGFYFGAFIDPVVVFVEITPSWLIAVVYGLGMVQYRALDQIMEFFQLMGHLVCGPFLISGPVTFLIVWAFAQWLDKRP